MHLDYTTSGGALVDHDNFRELDVRIPASTDAAAIQDWLRGFGADVEGDHVWAPVSALERFGRPTDGTWLSQFHEMVGHAERAGWVRTVDGVRQVRAHRIADWS